MRQKIIYAAALTALATTSASFAGGPEIIAEDYFSGFYVGGTVAVHSMTTDQSALYSSANSITIPVVTFLDGTTATLIAPGAGSLAALQAGGGSLDIYGGVQGGFNKVFNHQWLLGVVGFWEGGSQNASSSSQQNNSFSVTSTNPFGDVITSTGLANVNT